MSLDISRESLSEVQVETSFASPSGLAEYDIAVSSPDITPASITVADTNEYGFIILHAFQGWQFTSNPPERVINGRNLHSTIPANIGDMTNLRDLPNWNNYGWFEIELIADSTIAGRPRMITYNGMQAMRLWHNGVEVITAGNPSRNSREEVLSRFWHEAFNTIAFTEGVNYFLIEYSGHNVSSHFTRFQILPDGLLVRLFEPVEPSLRRYRAFIFGGGATLLLLLVVIHSFLAYKFRNAHHFWVTLTTLFLLIHIFVSMSDTLINWTFAYITLYEYVNAVAFILAMYFFLIAIREVLKLVIPWKTLTSILGVSVVLAIIFMYVSPILLSLLHSILTIAIMGYGIYTLIEAKRKSPSTTIWIIAAGLIVTVTGAMLYVLPYLLLDIHHDALFMTAVILAYTGIPVALTFNVANNYADLIDTLEARVKERTIELEAANEYQNRFFANISHEFRTPLTIGEGLVNKLLRVKQYESRNVRHDLSVVKRNMNRLHDMVNQIIDLTKSDENHLTLRPSYYQADKLASISVESFRSLAEYHGHRFVFQPGAPDAVLYADRAKVEIMINNLISNAIKFTPEGGRITVKTFLEDGAFALTVLDTGSGIPPGQEEIIFERFHRLKRDDDEYVEGMGVGLELSRTLARLHDGEIVALPGIKTGALFKLTLPTVEPAHPDEILPLDTLEDELLYADAGTAEDVESDEKQESFHILIVEDNDDMMEYVSGIVSGLGTVRQAANGKQALEMLRSYTPDIIITDLMMPVMGGLELVETLKGHEKWSLIPVVVLTAKALEEDKLHLLRIGVVDYITKPFVHEQLVLKIRNLLAYYHRRNDIRLELSAEDVPPVPVLADKAAAFVREHLRNTQLSVDMMADEFSQSKRSFYRNLQLETGMTPAEFIREVRLVTARSIAAANKNMLLKELADAVGYKSATSFRKVYEERFGEHPLG
ncbi:MAG: response regulator [Balneolales bacterium]|nr:response regulator [Balneolales bacterium]